MKSFGTLRYGDSNWLVVDVDSELARYYRSFIPKNCLFNVPLHSPHITVVNGRFEVPVKSDKWKLYEGETIEFDYNTQIYVDELYMWLHVDCKRLEEIRTELGLTECFDNDKGFHITIANMKGV